MSGIEPFSRPTRQQLDALIAASPDIRPECIRQAGEYLDYLTAVAKTWIMNGDDHHGMMLQTLCLAFSFQQTEIERLRVENINRRAATADDVPALVAEVERLRAIVQRAEDVCDLMLSSPLEAVQMWARLNLQPALAGDVPDTEGRR